MPVESKIGENGHKHTLAFILMRSCQVEQTETLNVFL